MYVHVQAIPTYGVYRLLIRSVWVIGACRNSGLNLEQ